MGGGGSLGGLRRPWTPAVRRSIAVALTTVTAVGSVGAWAALDESVAAAATQRLAHHVFFPRPEPKPAHPVSDRYDDPFCSTAFFGSPMGSLQKSTSAGPNGSTVLPGQQVTVTLTWNPRDFGWPAPTIVEDCVEIGSRISSHLSQDHRPGPAGGTDRFSYAMPSGGTDGQQVCDRGVVVSSDPSWDRGQGEGQDQSEGGRWGQRDHGQDQDQEDSYGGSPFDAWRVETSPVLCYTILDAMAPEASQVLFFPLAGLAVGGGAYVVARRHRRSRGRHAASHAD